MQELQANQVVDQFLAGLMYPVSKTELLERAAEAQLTDEVMAALNGLPDREYQKPAEVAKELNPA
ncbi:MAG: DUF2795 domain-containing protein [Chloroflexi bacterium]|nr:MAG: DUF2795 domain-containing protein [Chloroflexota bacterium]